MSQSASRKRPAPGSSPIDHDFSQPSLYPTRSTRLATARNTQRLQAQRPAASNSPLDPTSNPNDMASQRMMPGGANQLTRRPMNQTMIMRNAYQNGGNDGWPGAPQPPPDSNWMTSPEDERIEQEAIQVRDRAGKSRKSIPPFVQKLRRYEYAVHPTKSLVLTLLSFLDDPKNINLIRWSQAGNSFVVEDEEDFAKTLIPELFKHANYASFVRQLNMYGFHKKVGLSDNSMRSSERKNKSPSEYHNQYFRRDKPDWMWLISKPKAVGSKSRGSRAKQGEGNLDDEDEILEGELPATPAQLPVENGAGMRGSRQPLMIGQGDATGTPEQLAALTHELRTIQQQHHNISAIIQRLRHQHEQQAAQFQEQHNRHENSINAILQFLATVYQRNLEGTNQNMAKLGNPFGAPVPHEMGKSGKVVDMGDIGVAGLDVQNGQVRRSPRRPPLLLNAPPASDAQTVHTMSAASTPAAVADTPTPGSGGMAGVPSLEEMQAAAPRNGTGFTNSPRPRSANGTLHSGADGDMLSLINSTNAQDANAGYANKMDFPEALSHLQNANGNSPLSNTERNSMLARMAGASGADLGQSANFAGPVGNGNGNGNGAPWAGPSEADFAFLERTMKEQADKMSTVSNVLRPLSPNGSIPGLHDDRQGTYVPPPPPGLDLDNFFNTNDYYADAAGVNGGAAGGGVEGFGDGMGGPNGFGATTDDFDFGQPGTGAGAGHDANAGFSFDGANDEDDGPQVETVNNSAATSPANTVEEVGTPEETNSPRKKRKRN